MYATHTDTRQGVRAATGVHVRCALSGLGRADSARTFACSGFGIPGPWSLEDLLDLVGRLMQRPSGIRVATEAEDAAEVERVTTEINQLTATRVAHSTGELPHTSSNPMRIATKVAGMTATKVASMTAGGGVALSQMSSSFVQRQGEVTLPPPHTLLLRASPHPIVCGTVPPLHAR